MLDLKKLGESAMREGMKLMGNPRVMKVMSNPRVMKVMMQAFQLRGTVEAVVDQQVRRLAHTFKLATREEVRDLEETVRHLEADLERVRERADGETHRHHSHG